MTEEGASPVPGAGPDPPAAVERSEVDRIERAVRRFQERRGREDAFRLLYETYFHPLQRFFARKGLSPEDCLDLTQETFLGIYRGLDGYENRQRFVAWLYRVATTTFLKWRRAGATAKRGAVEVSRDAMENPDNLHATPGRQLDGLLVAERQQALSAAIAELPEQMRDCLTLRLHQQLAYREIALIKRISIETVKAHLFRARKKLQERLAGYDLDDLEV
ncbi:MAG TPA: RNA polymerase sigma factor [Thermoanaerobaculia bacterium]|nr:RNA polymerase sigma factor [Thermoanaerobaculia bacterium]